MNIAFFGASSQIAKSLIKKFIANSQHQIIFFVRDKESFKEWLEKKKISYDISDIKLYSEFSVNTKLDMVINCVGVGDPAKAISIRSSIESTTKYFDEMILRYLESNSKTKYIFLSSGIAYGDIFSAPARSYGQQNINLNSSKPENTYAISKINAENLHRNLTHLSIIDIRIFSYLSDEIDVNSKFFITDVLRAIKDKKIFLTNKKNITRDYIGADDLYQLITKLYSFDKLNTVVDAYSKEPISKITILEFLHASFGLQYKYQDTFEPLNATGNKDNYYSRNFHAKKFGYSPKYSSKEIIEKVIRRMLFD